MMPDISKFTDRDLLVMTVQKVSGLEDKVNSMVERLEDHEARLRTVEHHQAKQDGGVGLGKWMVATLTALAGAVLGALGMIFGKTQ